MKILVPTDFSIFSDHAIDMARQIAEFTDCEIIIFHCVDPESTDTLFLHEGSEMDDISLKINKFRTQKLNELQEVLLSQRLQATTKLVSGNFLKELSKVVSEKTIDLVIMGSHGHGGIEKLLIGSNTLEVLRHVHANTLVVKDQIENFNFSQVVFASSLELRDRKSFEKLKNFLSPFHVDDVHILTIDTTGAFAQPSFAMKAALKEFELLSGNFIVHTHFKHDSGVIKGIQYFCDQHDIDLIVMSNHEKSVFSRIFEGSPLEKLVYRSSTPVLSLTC